MRISTSSITHILSVVLDRLLSSISFSREQVVAIHWEIQARTTYCAERRPDSSCCVNSSIPSMAADIGASTDLSRECV